MDRRVPYMYRRQQVRVNSKYSYFKSVLSGIPQGSILGPLEKLEYLRARIGYPRFSSFREKRV